MADNNGLNPWPKEDIPGIQCLFKRVHRNLIMDGMPIPGAFRDYEMSTNWCKWSTAQQTQGSAKNPHDNGVVQMLVHDVRGIEGLTVQHTPDLLTNNRAHADVLGDKTDVQVRVKLRQVCKWVIHVPDKA